MNSSIYLIIVIALSLLIGGVLTKYFGAADYTLSNMLLYVASLIPVLFVRSLAWLKVSEKKAISYVVPILSLNYLLALLIGSVLFNEPVHAKDLFGSLFILAGVLVLQGTSKK